MRRMLLVLTLLALGVGSCASTWYTVRPVTGTAPTQDNFTRDCAAPDTLVTAPAGTVTVRCEWWQNAVILRADSLVVQRGQPFTFVPPSFVPDASKVTATVRSRDTGGTSCPTSMNLTPVATLVPPARVASLAVAP